VKCFRLYKRQPVFSLFAANLYGFLAYGLPANCKSQSNGLVKRQNLFIAYPTPKGLCFDSRIMLQMWGLFFINKQIYWYWEVFCL